MTEEKKNKKKKTQGGIGSWFRRAYMGEFINYTFFMRNKVNIFLLILLCCLYTASRYKVQSRLSQIITLKTELAKARTEKVKASAAYNSLIREPEMRERIKQAGLDLQMPDEPHYRLD